MRNYTSPSQEAVQEGKGALKWNGMVVSWNRDCPTPI